MATNNNAATNPFAKPLNERFTIAPPNTRDHVLLTVRANEEGKHIYEAGQLWYIGYHAAMQALCTAYFLTRGHNCRMTEVTDTTEYAKATLGGETWACKRIKMGNETVGFIVVDPEYRLYEWMEICRIRRAK